MDMSDYITAEAPATIRASPRAVQGQHTSELWGMPRARPSRTVDAAARRRTNIAAAGALPRHTPHSPGLSTAEHMYGQRPTLLDVQYTIILYALYLQPLTACTPGHSLAALFVILDPATKCKPSFRSEYSPQPRRFGGPRSGARHSLCNALARCAGCCQLESSA